MDTLTSPTFATWLADLSERGFRVLGAHAVPVQLWLQAPAGRDVLHFLARGTRMTLRRYDASYLTALILRSTCDCEEHRTAGAGVRQVLAPGAAPTAESVFDGAVELGWSRYEAGLAGVGLAAEVFEGLLGDVVTATGPAPSTAPAGVAPGAGPLRPAVETPALHGSTAGIARNNEAGPRGSRRGGAHPVATGRAGSRTQALHEPA